MSPDDLSTMTLRELEELAGRMEAAARTIRDAMAMLGGGPALTRPEEHRPQDGYRLEPALGAPYRALEQPIYTPIAPSHPNLLTPERQARMQELRMDPAREALLRQFKGDGGKPEDAPVRRETLDTVSEAT